MAKFKKGDRVRRVSGHPDDGDMTPIGGYNIVDEDFSNIPYGSNNAPKGRYNVINENEYELATPEPIPDTVTIGGVEYIRKPEPEHVWAWGQWARVKGEGVTYDGNIVFITGGIDDSGFVPITCEEAVGEGNSDGVRPKWLTYLGTATIPE